MIFHGWCVDGHLISVGSKRDETSIDYSFFSSDEEWWTFVFFLLWYILMLTEADQGELTKRGPSVSQDLCAGGHRWILLMISSSSKSLRPSLHHPWVEQSHSPHLWFFWWRHWTWQVPGLGMLSPPFPEIMRSWRSWRSWSEVRNAKKWTNQQKINK